MKKTILLSLFLLPFCVIATNYVSVRSGTWSNPTTWGLAAGSGLYPQTNSDNATIVSGTAVTSTDNQELVNDVIINSGGILVVSSTYFAIKGILTNNGLVEGASSLALWADGTALTGNGGWSTYTGPLYFKGNNQIIDATVNLNSASVIIYYLDLTGNPQSITNNGTLTVNEIIDLNSGINCTWINAANSSLSIQNNSLTQATDVLTANAAGNTVQLGGSTGYNIKNPTGSTFYNLQIANTGTKTLTYDATLLGSFTIAAGGKLNANAHNITIAGNWTNNITTGGITNNTGTVTFNGSANQTIGGTTATIFNNLLINTTSNAISVLLGVATTVSNNLTISQGIFNSQNFQVTGNVTGGLNMAAGTSLLLGLTTNAANVLFPTSYTTPHCALNATSTVTYQANGAQTVSTVPTYGNVIITNGASAAIKTPSGTPLTIAGNLTITPGTGPLTLSQTTNNINLTGNYISSGTLSFSTGAFNIGSNFSNNGAFTAGTGTATFNGSAAQALGGSSPTTFNLLTINNSAAATVTLGNNIIVGSTLTLTKGTLDVSASNYSVSVAGDFINNASFTSRAGTVTMNGIAAQALGGTTSTTFYNLTSNGATVTLGNNENISNNLLINSGNLDASASNYNLTVGQNFTNNATFTGRNGTVTFTGNTSTPLNINGASATTFYNLITNTTNTTDVLLMGVATTVNNNFTITKGIFNSQNFQVTGNVTGGLNMAAGTSLLLGLTTNAANVLFPTSYTTPHCALNATSTVTYQANGAQTVSTVPTYGNVIITNGASAAIKTPSGTPLTIAGNLTITPGTGPLTLSQTTNNINLTGNYISSGTLSFSTGAFNIGSNFSNNGAFTAGTGTATFNGSAAQALGGSSPTTFNLLTINNSAAATVTLGNNIIVGSTLTLTKGTLDVSASNYSVSVAGDFINNASFTSRAGTVTMNGIAAQALGGTTSTTFYNLTSNGATVTLGNNENISNNLLINSGNLDASASNYNLTVGQNFTNNATFTGRNGTVTFTGSAAQALGGTSVSTFGNLTINNSTAAVITLGVSEIVGANLTLTQGILDVSASNYGLTVGGNFTNNAAFNAETGTVTFNGAALQTLGGSNNTRFSSMTLSGTGGLNLVTNTGFTSALTISNSGSLSSSAGIYDTIISNASTTAYIAQVTGSGTITANFVAQRYESARGTSGQYATLSTPMTGAETLADWETSNTTAPNIFYMSIDNSTSAGVYSVYNYVETMPSAGNAQYVPIKTSTTAITQGEGLYIMLATGYIGGTLFSMVNPFTYIQHGTPNVGTVNVAVTKTPAGQNGTNLIGNPYASPISWSQFKLDNAGLALQASYYIHESSGSWVATAGNFIPMCQGFCVVVGSAGTISFKEDQKLVGNPALLRNEAADPKNSVTLILSNNANSYSCPTTVSFDSKFSKSYSTEEDAYYLQSLTTEVPVLYTSTENNENLQINALPDSTSEVDVPLSAIGEIPAMHTLTIQNLNNLTSYKDVALIDKKTGQLLVDFKESPSYNFDISQSGQEKDFILRFGPEAPSSQTNKAALNNVLIHSNSAGALINFSLAQPENSTISVYTIMGQKLQDIDANVFTTGVQINLPNSGIFIIRVMTPEGVTTQKIYH